MVVKLRYKLKVCLKHPNDIPKLIDELGRASFVHHIPQAFHWSLDHDMACTTILSMKIFRAYLLQVCPWLVFCHLFAF
jgi:hypothetical protein